MAESGHEIDNIEEVLGNNQLIKDYVLFVLTEGVSRTKNNSQIRTTVRSFQASFSKLV